MDRKASISLDKSKMAAEVGCLEASRDWMLHKAYRPIALLNAIGSILESIVSERLRFAAENPTSLKCLSPGR
jgi:hypothetical protein